MSHLSAGSTESLMPPKAAGKQKELSEWGYLCDEISVKRILSTLCCFFIRRQISSDLLVWVDATEERRRLWQLVFLRGSALTATWWLKTSAQLVSRHVSQNIGCLGPQSHKHRTGMTAWPLNKQVLVLEPEQTKGNKKSCRTDLWVGHWSWCRY